MWPRRSLGESPPRRALRRGFVLHSVPPCSPPPLSPKPQKIDPPPDSPCCLSPYQLPPAPAPLASSLDQPPRGCSELCLVRRGLRRWSCSWCSPSISASGDGRAVAFLVLDASPRAPLWIGSVNGLLSRRRGGRGGVMAVAAGEAATAAMACGEGWAGASGGIGLAAVRCVPLLFPLLRSHAGSQDWAFADSGRVDEKYSRWA